MALLLCALAAIAMHRLWHHEAVFASARARIPTNPKHTPLVFAPIAAALTLCPSVLTVIALYAVLRAAVWAYEKYDPPPAVGAGCGCQKAPSSMVDLQIWLRAKEKRVITVGFSSNELRKLSASHPEWALVDISPVETVKAENVLHWSVGADLTADLIKLILNGGNATIATFDKLHDSQWKNAIERIGDMTAVAWVHSVFRPRQVLPALPKHHAVITTGFVGIDEAIKNAQPKGI